MQWQNDPPKPTEFAGVRLIRVPQGKDLEGIITCSHLVGHITHWYKRRTIPCLGPDCPADLEGVPGRWHGYLSVYCTRNHAQYVLELTALAATSVAEYAERHGDLRGSLLRAARNGNRPNSPVSVMVYTHDTDLRTLPRGIDLEKFLETIWSIAPKREDAGPNPPAGQNIRNTLPADPPGSPPQALRFPIHPLIAERAKSNGDAQ